MGAVSGRSLPPSFLPPSRNPSLGRGRGPAQSPPSGYPRARARRGSTVNPAFEQESIPGTRERPRPISPLWVPACAGTTWFHRHSCLRAGIHPWDAGEAPPHIPPLGTRMRGHGVVPPSFLPLSRNPSLGRGEAPPHIPLWVPACAGTTWFHRHSCLRAGIHPWDAGGLAPSPPSG